MQHQNTSASLLHRITPLIWLLLGILETFIVLHILLTPIGVDPENSIVTLIYGFTSLFLLPFEGMAVKPGAGTMLLEISSLLAMVTYALMALALERIVWMFFYHPHSLAVSVKEPTHIFHK